MELDMLAGDSGAFWVLKLFIAAFFGVLFLQSGLDKVLNFSGNKSFITDYFKNSPLYGPVTFLFVVLTVLEVASGVFSALGFIMLLITDEQYLAYIGVILSGISLLSLFFGQRMAQDYPGAANLTGYFAVFVLAMIVFSL